MRGAAARPTSPGPAAASRVRTVSAAAAAIAAKRTDGQTAGPTSSRAGGRGSAGAAGAAAGAEGRARRAGLRGVCAFPNCQCIKSVTNAAAPGRVCQRLLPGIAAQCNNGRKAGAPTPHAARPPRLRVRVRLPHARRGSQKQRPGWAPCRFSSRGAGRTRAGRGQPLRHGQTPPAPGSSPSRPHPDGYTKFKVQPNLPETVTEVKKAERELKKTKHPKENQTKNKVYPLSGERIRLSSQVFPITVL